MALIELRLPVSLQYLRSSRPAFVYSFALLNLVLSLNRMSLELPQPRPLPDLG